MDNGTAFEVEVDGRNRLPLGKLVQCDKQRFRVTPLDDGEILLSPVISVSVREMRVIQNPGRLASLKEGIAEAGRGDVVKFEPGHFSRLAGSLGPDSQEPFEAP